MLQISVKSTIEAGKVSCSGLEYNSVPHHRAAFDPPQSELVELERCLHAERWEEKVRYAYDDAIGEAQL